METSQRINTLNNRYFNLFKIEKNTKLFSKTWYRINQLKNAIADELSQIEITQIKTALN